MRDAWGSAVTADGSALALTLLREVFGALAGLSALGSLAVGTHALSRRFLSTLKGPPALLADLVGVLSITIVASQLLGVIGLFRFYAVAPVAHSVRRGRVVVGDAGDRSATAARTQADTEVDCETSAPQQARVRPRGGPIVNGIAIVAVGILAAAGSRGS